MATSEGHTSDFHIVLTNMENQSSGFDHEPEYTLYYRSPIVLNPNVEWEAASIDTYIPTPQKETVVSKGMSPYKHHWFRYIVSIERRTTNADDYFSYQKWYYTPHDQESGTHSFIKRFNEGQKRRDTYRDFTYLYYPDKLTLYVSDDDHFCIRVNRVMVHPLEVISIQMPVVQIAEIFGNTVEFETWYRTYATPCPIDLVLIATRCWDYPVFLILTFILFLYTYIFKGKPRSRCVITSFGLWCSWSKKLQKCQKLGSIGKVCFYLAQDL